MTKPTLSPLISIAIPAYKGRWLEDAIKSVLSQDFTDFELIVVNDCSPDDIGSIVSSFSDERIKYYVNEMNIGGGNLTAQWNHCLSFASGVYFCLLADDDYYEPQYLSTMLALAAKYPQSNVFRSRLKIIDANGDFVDYYPSSPEYETLQDYLWHVLKGYRKQTISEFMLVRDALIKQGGYATTKLAWGADYLSIYNLCADGGIVSSTKALVNFRDSGENLSSNQDKLLLDKLIGSYEYHERIKKIIEDNFTPPIKEDLLKLNESRLNNHKNWLLNTASIHSLCDLLKNHDGCGYVTNNRIILHIFNKLSAPIRAFFSKTLANFNSLVKKVQLLRIQSI